MGAKAKQPSGARRKKGASKRAANASAEERHRYYPDSIPPGMAAEVFDVSRIDEDGLEVLDDDEVEQEVVPPPSLRPRSTAPHPPRPSSRAPQPPWPSVPSRPPPPPQRSLMPRPLGPDDLHRDTPLSYSSNPVPLHVEPDASIAPQEASGPGRAFGWAAAGAIVALLVGMALGRRDESRPTSSTTEARHATAPGLEGARGNAPFSRAQAAAAIEAAVARANACRAPSTPSGPLVVRLMFAQTGQAVGVDVRGPLAGTAAGDCFAAALRDVRVPSFEGGIASVDHTIEAP